MGIEVSCQDTHGKRVSKNDNVWKLEFKRDSNGKTPLGKRLMKSTDLLDV